MKRFCIAAAALALAGCQTAYPPVDPYYGQPSPPPIGTPPYPGAPAADPYGADRPGFPGPAMTGRCPIVSSRDWNARVEPSNVAGERPKLVVNGTIVAPTGGYRMEFDPYLQALETRPLQLSARLNAIPPQGMAIQALTTHDVRWQWPLQAGPVGSVIVECGQQRLAAIPVADRP